MNLKLYVQSERPELREFRVKLETGAFPDFLIHDPIWDNCIPYFNDQFADFQVYLWDDDDGVLVLAANVVPFHWDGHEETFPKGTHDVMQLAMRQFDEEMCPNMIACVSAVIEPTMMGRGLSKQIIQSVMHLAATKNIGLVIPVRPILKHLYPLVAMQDYVTWKRDDGKVYDPWLRTQLNLGATFRSVCEHSLNIVGKVKEWESWTKMIFPQSGLYVIPGGHVPVEIDHDRNVGEYSEPHVWYEYSTKLFDKFA